MLNKDTIAWLKNKLNVTPDSKSHYALTFTANTISGEHEVKVELDLIWFVMIQAEDTPQKKLQVVKELLSEIEFLAQFKNTIAKEDVALKRLLSEFLLYNREYLQELKKHIDFKHLNVPIDFISHALFIKLADADKQTTQDQQRLEIVNAVLESGFKLDQTTHQSPGAAMRRVLLMDLDGAQFKTARKLLEADYKLFNQDNTHNAEMAVFITTNRENSDCLAILKALQKELKEITLPVAGSKNGGNLADYFYWVKEDLQTVDFLKKELGLELTPST